MDDPYVTLGVGRDADRPAIMKAFRRKAQKAHPDRKGGDASEFRSVVRAKDILSDPGRRAHFDRTGEDVNEQQRSTMLTDLAGLIATLIDQCPDVEHLDILQGARETINAAMSENLRRKRQQKLKIDKQRKAVRRIKTKSGDAMLATMLLATIKQQEAAMSQIETAIAQHQAMLAFLDDYSYEIDEHPAAATTTRFSFRSAL